MTKNDAVDVLNKYAYISHCEYMTYPGKEGTYCDFPEQVKAFTGAAPAVT